MSDRASGAARPGVFLCSRELGCPVNLSLTTRLHNYVLGNGWALRDADGADFIVIVACGTLPDSRQGVTNAARYYAERYPAKKIVVTCCYLEEDKVDAPNVAYIPLGETDEFDALFGAAVPLRANPSGATRADEAEVRELHGRTELRNRPYNVVVSAGCLSNCSFCIGRRVFPTMKSVPLADVVAQCQEGLRKGYTNFVIGASDVAAYGHDLGHDVTELFSALFTQAFTGQRELVIGFKGFEPSGFLRHYDKLREHFRAGRISWICLPIQSGSDSVLEAMRRRYRVADVLAVVKDLRAISPGLRIETDLIYCFPTETREDFEASLKMFEHFDHVQMLAYERHEGTRAAAMRDVFSAEEKERRRAIVKSIEHHETDFQRPECRERIDVRLPSPLGETGFGVLEVPK